MRHLRRKRRIPSSNFHGLKKPSTSNRKLSIKCLVVCIFIEPHSRQHHCKYATQNTPQWLSDYANHAGNVNVSPLVVEMFHLSSREGCVCSGSLHTFFVCLSRHVTFFEVPFVLQICLLHESPLICKNANAQIPISIQDVASGNHLQLVRVASCELLKQI